MRALPRRTGHGGADTTRAAARRRLRWLASAGAAGVVLGGAVLGSRMDSDTTLVRTPLLGKTVPDRTLPALEGGAPLDLSDLRGKVAVVNFWASWCVPCRRENPSLVALSQTYPDVAFAGVVFQDQPRAAVAFLDELKRGAGNYRYLRDTDSQAALDFGVFGLPETFVLDKSGVIRAKIVGEASYPLLASAIEDVLAGRQPDSRTEGLVQPGPGEPQVRG